MNRPVVTALAGLAVIATAIGLSLWTTRHDEQPVNPPPAAAAASSAEVDGRLSALNGSAEQAGHAAGQVASSCGRLAALSSQLEGSLSCFLADLQSGRAA